MFSKSFILLSTLAATTLAAPTLIARQAGSWTLQSFTRKCDDSLNVCQYDFGINENDGSAVTQCSYLIFGNGSSARTTDYQNHACVDGGHFSLNQGYDAGGDFIVLVVTE